MTWSRRRTAVAAGCAAAAAIVTGIGVLTLEDGPGVSDTAVYRNYGERMTHGDVPYRDFAVEYPPGALLPFVLPASVSSTPGGFDDRFEALMIAALAIASVFVVLCLRVLEASVARCAVAVAALLLGVALLGPFALTRFDLYAAAVTLAATWALVSGRGRLGPVLLGLAIATKLYPAVLLPLVVARVWRRSGRRPALQQLGLTAATALVLYLPFLILAPEGVARSVWRQLGRPLQIESLGSGILLGLHHAAGLPLGWASGNGSQNLTGTVATLASTVTTVAGVAALALVWGRYARGDPESAARFVRYAAAAIVAFVAFGKVLSPQFLVWLLAAVVIVVGSRGAVATCLLLSACALTRIWFPRAYWELVKEFDPTASWLVLVRDLVLVGVFVSLVARLRARGREPSGSQLPAR